MGVSRNCAAHQPPAILWWTVSREGQRGLCTEHRCGRKGDRSAWTESGRKPGRGRWKERWHWHSDLRSVRLEWRGSTKPRANGVRAAVSRTYCNPPTSSEIRTNRGTAVWRRAACGRVESRHSVSTDIVRPRQTESERSSDAVCGTDGVSPRRRRSRSTPERASCEAGCERSSLSGGCCGSRLWGDQHQSEQVAKQVASAQTPTHASRHSGHAAPRARPLRG